MKSLFKFIIESILTAKARAFLKQNKVQVIAVTGSIGKTSTKEAIYTILKSKFEVAASQKSFNTPIGMSLAILGEEESGFTSVSAWLKILKRVFMEERKAPRKMILEMGADKPGDIQKLMAIASPQISVVTNVNPVHLGKGQFRTIEEIAKEKGTLVRLLSQSGLAILNGDDPRVRNMETRATKFIYGVREEGILRASKIHATGKHLTFSVAYKGSEERFEVPVVGEFQVFIFLPAIAVGLSMGMSLTECAEALTQFKLPPGRMNPIVGLHDSQILDGSYNASPTTVSAALDMLRLLKAERKIAALGTMNELGELSQEAHLKIGEKAFQIADILIAVGKESPTIKKGAVSAGMEEEAIFTFFDSEEAGKFLANKLQKGDVILVKGSQNQVRMEKLVKEIMLHPEKASELLCRQGTMWKNQ